MVVLLCATACSYESHEAGLCAPASIAAALASASEGDVVSVGRCRVDGPFVVRPGVTLAGGGAGGSIIGGPPGTPAVTLEPGSGRPTRLLGLTVEGGGVTAAGAGAIEIERVRIAPISGNAVEARDVTSIAIHRSILEPLDPVAAERGIDARCVQTLDVFETDVRGFRRFGAIVIGGAAIFERSRITDGDEVLLAAFGTEIGLYEVELCRLVHRTGLIAYGAVFANGTAVESEQLVVCENEALAAVLQSESSASHVDLVIRDNDGVGYWAQWADGLAISGVSEISANQRAGLLATASARIALRGTRIAETRAVDVITGETGTTRVGDGIALVGSQQGLVLDGVHAIGNERAGIVLDLAGDAFADALLGSITVDGTGDQLGIVVQNGLAPEGWDVDVTRLGVTARNDAEFDATGRPLRGLPTLPPSAALPGVAAECP